MELLGVSRVICFTLVRNGHGTLNGLSLLCLIWLVTGPVLVSVWCFSGCVPSVAGNGVWSLGGTAGRRDGSQGGVPTGRVPTTLNQVGSHANSASISVCLFEPVAVMLTDIQSLLPVVDIHYFFFFFPPLLSLSALLWVVMVLITPIRVRVSLISRHIRDVPVPVSIVRHLYLQRFHPKLFHATVVSPLSYFLTDLVIVFLWLVQVMNCPSLKPTEPEAPESLLLSCWQK